MSIVFVFFLIGTLFGSFSTVLIDRWRNGKRGILFGRSECPKCRHPLSWKELFPLFSYIFQKGRCRSCRTKISLFYPLSELLMGLIFMMITWGYLRNGGELFSLSHMTLLAMGFVTGVYTLYDLRYTEIPDEIMVPAIGGILLILILMYFFPEAPSVFFDQSSYLGGTKNYLYDHLIGALALYTFFYLQILIPGALYFLRKRRWKDSFELALSYIMFPISLFLPSKKKEEGEAIPTWIGGGDLRIAIFIGLSLGTLHGISSLMIAYISGSIFGIFFLLAQRKKSHQITHMIPFGPFLGIGWCVSVIFHGDILLFVENYFSYI